MKKIFYIIWILAILITLIEVICALWPSDALGQFSSPVKLTAVDTDGDGDIDGYMTTMKKGSNVTLTLNNQVVTVAPTAGGGDAGAEIHDSVWVYIPILRLNMHDTLYTAPWRINIHDSLWVYLPIDSTDIANGALSLLDLAQWGATTGQVIKWDGSKWAPGTDAGGGGGTSDSLTVADSSGAEYSILNNLLKMKGGSHLYIVRQDSGTYDVLILQVFPDSAKADTSKILTIAELKDTVALVIEDSLDAYLIDAAVRDVAHDTLWAWIVNYTLLTDFAKVTDDTSAWKSYGDSIAVDDNNDGVADRYIRPAMISEGTNVTFSGTGDRLIISASGTGGGDDVWADTSGALTNLQDYTKMIIQEGRRIILTRPNDTTLTVLVDSTQFFTVPQIRDSVFIYLDTDGNGTFDAQIAPIYIRAGSSVSFSVNTDTLTISATGGSGTVDTVWFVNDASTDSASNVGNALHLKWGTGIDATLSGKTLTVVVDKAELSLSFADLSGAATDVQIPNDITINFADSTDKVTHETAQDRVGEMVTGNTETGIAVTYDDTGGKLNFAVTIPVADVDTTGTQIAAALNKRPDTTISITGSAPLNGGGNLQGDRTIGLNEQSINKAYIDTGAGIPFGQAYHKTTAVAESAFVTEHRVPEIAPTLLDWGKVTDDTATWHSYGDSIAVDEDNDGIADRYIRPGMLSEGTNITFSGTADRLIITGSAGGSGDNAKVDTNGTGAGNVVDIGTFIIQAGPRMQVDVVNSDTVLICPDSASFFSMNAMKDTIALVIEDSLDGYMITTLILTTIHDSVWVYVPILRQNIHDSIWVDVPLIVEDSLDNYSLATHNHDGTYLRVDGTDNVKDTHIDWGGAAGQVNTDDVPEGSTNKYNPFGTSIDGSEVTDQGLTKSDFDTTSSNVAFNDPYRITTEVPDSALATIKTAKKVFNDSIGVTDSSRIGNDKLSEDDINWRRRLIGLSMFHGKSSVLEDSIYFTLPQHNLISFWIASDSAGNITAGDDDTSFATAFMEEAFTLDSLIIFYKQKDANSDIVKYTLWGPDRSSGTDAGDSCYYGALDDSTTALTATSWTRVAIDINDVTVSPGEVFGIKFIVDFQADYAVAMFGRGCAFVVKK